MMVTWNLRVMRLMGRMSGGVGHEILHAGERLLLARLAGEHHEYDPLDLLGIQLLRIQGQKAVQDDFTLQRREDAVPLQVHQKAAGFSGQPAQFPVAVQPQARGAATRLFGGLQPDVCQVGQPVEGTFNACGSETHQFQVASQSVAFGNLGGILQHVAVKNVNQDIEDAGRHEPWTYDRRQYRPPGWGAIRPCSSSNSNMDATVCRDQPVRNARTSMSTGSKPAASNSISYLLSNGGAARQGLGRGLDDAVTS